ncbi:hypothetical conserved protein [Sulfolobus acidocaldarius DSM 639]|uniref:Uncharacterized protein n=3 Tax=Sulfolobus acidocaldarius TaxID=2285 RepID=M1J0G1_9CREN|nr:hypothetical conserved protein [Sulfolobus acidocaldarius DSM 639]AGE70528.1 hypothetical protein SacN8_02750 [Sulfolobus acidocaldarius N8]AGE72801.1 hypothetical protein SacRon12I_02740 [Sulfolobus acidocaldarius Ron12/I]
MGGRQRTTLFMTKEVKKEAKKKASTGEQTAQR